MSVDKIITPKSLKVPKRLKRLVIDSCKRHAWNIGVSHYAIDILWMAEDVKVGDSTLHGEMQADRRYLKGTLKIYPNAIQAWRNDGDPAIERLVSHEIAHLATEHFKDVAYARFCDDGELKDAWETVTEVISQLSVKLNEYRIKEKR